MSLDLMGTFLFQVFFVPVLMVAAVVMCIGALVALLDGLTRALSKSE